MSRRVKGEEHQIDGQQISWAGECPWTKALCFGSEDGTFIIPPGSIGQKEGGIAALQVASDAINSVAFSGDNVGITSRNEVLIGYRKDEKSFHIKPYTHSYKGGAHGIVGSAQDAFLAPIGSDGLLMLNLRDEREIRPVIAQHREVPLNFYRLVRLGDGPRGEVFACASRGDGLFALSFAGGTLSGPMIGHHFLGHDIVDVCALNDPQFPFAVACVSRARGIFFVRNILENQAPFALNYDELKGTAYTLLSAQGHLFLLTDREFVILPNVAARFLRGESVASDIAISTIPTEAGEAIMLGGESVLLLEGSKFAQYQVAELVKGLSGPEVEVRRDPDPRANGGELLEVTSEVSRFHYVPLNPGWKQADRWDLAHSPIYAA